MRIACALVAILLLGPWSGQRLDDPSPRSQGATSGLGTRLLGPLASVAASVEWVRFDRAVEAKNFTQAYAIANRALALDPASPHGWDLYAGHLIFYRGGALLEADPERRVDWIRAGLDLLAEGAAKSRAPATLHLIRGQILAFYVADVASDPEALPWPGGSGAASHAGIVAMEKAMELGHPKAHERKHQAVQAAIARGQRQPPSSSRSR